MAKEPYFERVAILDLDETLIEGSTGMYITKLLLDPRRNSNIIPRRYYLKAIRYVYVPLLMKLKRVYRVYRYLLHRSFALYQELLADPRVDGEGLRKLIREHLENMELPEVSRLFIQRLKEKGYRIVLLTATPQEFAEVLGRRLGVDEIFGSIPGRVFDRETKERFIRDKYGHRVDIVVGNPGNEPFWLARRYAIIVRSPRDLIRWIDKI